MCVSVYVYICTFVAFLCCVGICLCEVCTGVCIYLIARICVSVVCACGVLCVSCVCKGVCVFECASLSLSLSV